MRPEQVFHNPLICKCVKCRQQLKWIQHDWYQMATNYAFWPIFEKSREQIREGQANHLREMCDA